MKKILLTGASGTVGQQVLDQLYKLWDYDIVVFDIKSKKAQKIFRSYANITVHYGDITHLDDIAHAVEGVDTVIHLAAIIPPLADEHPKLAQAVNIDGTQNLIKSLAKYAPDAFLLYASSVSVYGDRVKEPLIRTTDPLVPSDRDTYAETKIAAEQLVKHSDLSWSIFRLSAIMGAGNHKITGIMFDMPLATPIELTTPSDAARAFVHAIEQRSKLNYHIYDLGGGKNCRISYVDLLTRSFEIYGLGKLDFPDHAFAEKNYHCGYYADGEALEDIVHFRQDTIDTYFSKVRNSVPTLQRLATRAVNKIIKKKLLTLSAPYKAYTTNDTENIKHYFEEAHFSI